MFTSTRPARRSGTEETFLPMPDAYPMAAEHSQHRRAPSRAFVIIFAILYPGVCLLLGTVSGLSAWAPEALFNGVLVVVLAAALAGVIRLRSERAWWLAGGWFEPLLAVLLLLLGAGMFRSPCAARSALLLLLFFCAVALFYLVLSRRLNQAFPGWVLPLTGALAAAWGLTAFVARETPRVASPLGHHNYMAGFLLLHLPLTFEAFATGKKAAARAGWLLALLLEICALVFTGSLAGIAVGFALAFGLAASRVAAGARPLATRLAPVAALVAVIAGGAVLLVRPDMPVMGGLRGRVLGIFARGADPSLSLENRVRFARAGAAMLAARPLAGWGLGSVPLASGLYREQTPGVAAAGEVIPQLHNLPVNVLAEGGLPAAALLLALFVMVLGRAGSAAGVALAAYALFSLADYQLDLPAIVFPLAVIAALAVRPRRPIRLPQAGLHTALALGFSALLPGAMLLMGASSAAHYLHAHGRTDAASRLGGLCGFYRFEAGVRADLEGRSQAAAGAYRQAAEQMPNVLPAAEQAGFVMLRTSPRAAIPWLERAAALDSYFTLAHFHVGRARLRAGDREGAVASFATSFLVQPATVYADAWNASPEREVYSASIERAIDRLFDMAARYPNSGPQRKWNELGTFLIGRRDVLPGGSYQVELFEQPAPNASIIAFRRAAYPLRAAPIVLRLETPVPHHPAGIGSIRGLPAVRAIDLLKSRLGR